MVHVIREEKMEEKHTMLNVEDVSFDTDNPRIKKALEKYGDKLNAERIHFALRSATDGDKGASSYTQLKDAILASDGVIFPITVIVKDNGYVCIDGNTRLLFINNFSKRAQKGLGRRSRQLYWTMRTNATLRQFAFRLTWLVPENGPSMKRQGIFIIYATASAWIMVR